MLSPSEVALQGQHSSYIFMYAKFLSLIKKRSSITSACTLNKRRCDYTLYFRALPCKLNSTLLENGPAPGSESPTFVSTVLCDQAMGSAMHNAPALQEGMGHERHTCTLRAILPKQGVAIGISVYMDAVLKKDQHKLNFFTDEPNRMRIFQLKCLHETFLFLSALYADYLCLCKHS